MEGKLIWKSKTFWVNLIAIVAMGFQSQTGYIIDAEAQAALLIIINGVLRVATKEPVVWSKNNAKGGFMRLRLLVVVALLSLAVLTLQGCTTGMVQPTQPGEVLAALEADYTTGVIAAHKAYDAGLMDAEAEALVDSLVEKIGYYFDRAEAAFKTGDRPGQSEWVKLIEPLVFELLMAVPK